MAGTQRLIACALLVLTTSCITGTWVHQRRFSPVTGQMLAEVRAGESDLGNCLDAMGAPLYVWELAAGRFALAYGWYDRLEWGISVSAPLTDNYSVSYSWDDIDQNLLGVVLIFDENEVLQSVDRGYLREIVPGRERRRPAYEAEEE